MKLYYFARSTAVPHKPNDFAAKIRRVLQLDGVRPCFQKRRPWRISMPMEKSILQAK